MSSVLETSIRTTRTDAGKRFQVLGAATGKARSPKVDLRVDGTTSVVTSDERRRRRLLSRDYLWFAAIIAQRYGIMIVCVVVVTSVDNRRRWPIAAA